VVATVGGGIDGYPVLEAAYAAVQHLQSVHPDLNAVFVTGPLMPLDQQEKLRARATTTCRVLTRADNFQLMAAADAIVSMGGYNSVCEALSVGRPLVIVPRSTHKIEQQIRAETLAARGLARWIHPKDLNGGESLAEALEWALTRDPRDRARLEGWTADNTFTPFGKRRVVRYELEARLAGGPDVHRYRWVGKFYDRDDDARRVATVLRELGSNGQVESCLAVPSVLAYHAPRRLLLLTYESGESMTTAMAQDTQKIFAAIGRTLATLHALPI